MVSKQSCTVHYTVRFVATPEEDTAGRLLFSQLLEHILLNAINPGQTEERGGEKKIRSFLFAEYIRHH